jgi:hypothetical protein
MESEFAGEGPRSKSAQGIEEHSLTAGKPVGKDHLRKPMLEGIFQPLHLLVVILVPAFRCSSGAVEVGNTFRKTT